MKKIYNEPKEIVVELGMEGQLLQGIVSGNGPSTGLDTQPGGNTDPDEGETASARTQSVWGEW